MQEHLTDPLPVAAWMSEFNMKAMASKGMAYATGFQTRDSQQALVKLSDAQALLAAKDAEIAALNAERDALRLDAGRLDWMEDKTVDTVYFDDGEILDVGGKHATHLRMALDAAIAQAVQP